ncbi:hypothetical protein KAI32_00760 [Candidatus Pacearchaeota archaeon]|nr:hypothetical protein [Candidatus Pacearchaeota archaeon]
MSIGKLAIGITAFNATLLTFNNFKGVFDKFYNAVNNLDNAVGESNKLKAGLPRVLGFTGEPDVYETICGKNPKENPLENLYPLKVAHNKIDYVC